MKQWCRTVIVCSVCTSAVLLHAQSSIAAALAARPILSTHGAADDALPSPPATVEDALHTAFLSAAIVFTGEVFAIDREPGAVVVRWHVVQGLRGVQSGGTHAQREWAGLWVAGAARYAVGQRALVLLHAPSVAGYESPVGGMDGIVPLRGNAGSSTVDLRWMAQHAAVTDAPRMRPVLPLRAAAGSFRESAAIQEAAARAAAQARSPQPMIIGPEPPSNGGESAPATGSDANARVDGTMVLAMMRAWQRSASAAQ